MIVTAYKTKKVLKGDNLFEILDEYLPENIADKSIVAVASKIVGICEGRVEEDSSDEHRDELAKKEADLYLPREYNQYGFMITIKNGIMIASGGVDHSNVKDALVMWPSNPQKSTNEIREYLIKKYGHQDLGVIITDSKTTPIRFGVTGVAIAHSGFEALKNYVGTPDIFGRIMQAEKTNVADSLATSATVVTGEGNEQQPLCVIEDIPFVVFQKRNPTDEEIKNLRIEIGDDIYSSLLTSVDWKKGGN